MKGEKSSKVRKAGMLATEALAVAAPFLVISLVSLNTIPNSGYDNLDYGEPAHSDYVTNRLGYALGFVNEWKQPKWVAYRLTPTEASSKDSGRSNRFMDDHTIPGGAAELSDYRRSGYDRGHLAPAGDMRWSKTAMADSFLMSNMSPQKPEFNRGIWCNLERHLRALSAKGKTLFIYTGPIFSPNVATNKIGRNGVLVPHAFYKAVLDETSNEDAIAFYIPNNGTNAPLSIFAMPIDALENLTGLDFFSTLPEEEQEKLESSTYISHWGLKGQKP